ncbi:MAG: fibronectin type III domain-containing protein, partial [Armatimonadetes bacterium]|nr:fibronectin type III domain-containing protein [Armatimonadota bacterium]
MVLASLLLLAGAPALHQPDSVPARDPMRPVTEVRRDGFRLQWFTAAACPTRIQLREGGPQAVLWAKAPRPDPWKGSGVRTIEAPGGPSRFHTLDVRGLKPGTRYSYRIFDPAA